MSEVFALKYRPRKLSDVVGQDYIAQTLSNAIGQTIPHAMLFTGPFGNGKTTCARIFAAMLNCEKGVTSEPCGECRVCRQIHDGNCIDVKEMNAASNRGIDDMRFLADYAEDRPLLCRYKVIIIDEAHGLSKDAVEAFLKLLEEPPENVVFILCTTDPQKLKPTIHSRCIPFRFSKVAWPEIMAHLQSVAEKEKIQVDEGSLKIAARMSKGSVRNSLNNLQLLTTFAGGKPVTVELAQRALGAGNDTDYFDLIDCVVNTDVHCGMKIVGSIFGHGADVETVLGGLMEHLRNLMVLTTCKSTAGLLFLTDDEKKRYVHQYTKVSIELIVAMISMLYEVTRGVAYSINPQVLLERFVVEACIKHAHIEREKKAASPAKT